MDPPVAWFRTAWSPWCVLFVPAYDDGADGGGVLLLAGFALVVLFIAVPKWRVRIAT